MTDEPKKGQSQDSQDNVSPDTPADATQTDSTQTVVDDVLPERFQGKSATEIAQSYAELEKTMGDQGREVGELKNELAYIKTQTQVQQGQQYQQPAQAGQQQADTNWEDKFIDNPHQATMQMLGQYDQYRRYNDAVKDFPRTLREVETLRPDLFGDKEIADQVANFVKQGVQQGSVLPEVQSDANSLIAIGAYLKDQKTWQNPQPNPVQPVSTENPVQVKRDTKIQEPIVWTRDEEDFIEHSIQAGIYKDKEEAVAEYRKKGSK